MKAVTSHLSGVPHQSSRIQRIVLQPAYAITLSVPKRVARILGGECSSDGEIRIASAEIGLLGDIDKQVKKWPRPLRFSRTECYKSTKTYLAELLSEGCDTEVCVVFNIYDWDKIRITAEALQITPGDFLLGCAGYNAAAALPMKKSRKGGHRAA